CKNLGTTHITNGCFRLDPVEWAIGEAAGALVAFCLDSRLSPSAVPNTPGKLRLLAELHRDSLYPMMGKDAWVAGADRREAPGPKSVRLGRRLRLRRQPPGSWQLRNGGVQRGVSKMSRPREIAAPAAVWARYDG